MTTDGSPLRGASGTRQFLRGISVLVRERPAAVAAALAATGALVAVAVSTFLFPHLTPNHDEGVYLRQADLLLAGQFRLRPPVVGPFRPWFFVRDGAALYPKYGPVTAATFAAGKLLGGFRVALAGVAAGVVALTYRTVREAFDARTGLLAAVLVLASPLFVIQSGTFLPYLPTLLWNLGFAAAYLGADRTGSRRLAAVAGLAVGVAFFARPYTAVLFALPFVGHALWTLRNGDRDALARHALTAAGGLAGVAAALAYNAALTGDPLLFPYRAFAPQDGLGFGHRALLGYAREYTPALAVRANLEVLARFATAWIVSGPLGALAAAGGVAVAVRRGLDARQAAVVGLVPSVALGNVYFWGNLNVLGRLGVPDDGLVSVLGPYYHVSLLLPTAAFAAVGLLAGWRRLRGSLEGHLAPRRAGQVVLAAGLVSAAVFGGAGALALSRPVGNDAAISHRLGAAYAPFQERRLDDGVVFLPTPYGDWLGHPFQQLRNDPGYDDGPVYALREDQFAVVDAFPDREYYRYSYRGAWTPFEGPPVAARLRRIRAVAGPAVRQRLSLGVPRAAERVSIRLSAGDHAGYVTVPANESRVPLTLTVRGDAATLAGPGVETSVPVGNRGTLVVRAFVDYGAGGGFAYRTELPFDRAAGRVRALTPAGEICLRPARCDGAAANVPGAIDRPGVALSTNVTTLEDP
ncbi:MAG: ArnT family glycosyltransferase [Haloarculaceae archaeon]